MKVNYLNLIGISLILSGCHSPNIIIDYDEFKKSKICKLDPYLIRNEFGFISSRQTFITLEKQSNEKIKAILTSSSNTSYAPFSSNPQIKFHLITANQTSEDLIFQGELLPTTYKSQMVCGSYGICYNITIQSSSVAFYLSETQLKQIISASKVEFFVDAGKNPLMGEINENEQEAFDLFLSKCAKNIGGIQ